MNAAQLKLISYHQVLFGGAARLCSKTIVVQVVSLYKEPAQSKQFVEVI